MGHFGYETTTDGSVTSIALRGEFDLATVPGFEDELRRAEEARPTVLVLDLSQLDFLDSSALRCLVMADERARAQARRVVVVHGPPHVRRVFEITHIDQRLELVDDASSVASSA